MTRTRARRLVVLSCAAAVWAGVAAPPAHAQAAAARGRVPAEIVAATDFLLLAYPDLATRGVTFTFNRQARTVAVSVADRSTGDAVADADRPPLLNAAFAFTETGELHSFAANGVLLDPARNKALTDTLHANPDWTDTDAEAILQSLGGRPSTGTAPVASFDPARLARFVGGTPAVAAATLEWRPPGDPSAPPPFAAAPAWTTHVIAARPDGTSVAYRFHFEPFVGRLVMVTRP